MRKIKSLKGFKKIAARIIGCLILGFIGMGGLMLMVAAKEPPAEAPIQEIPLRVEGIRLKPENVTVMIAGYGEVISLTTVPVAAEVTGRVIEVHPQLEPGVVIPKDQTLFRIDSREYQAAFDEATDLFNTYTPEYIGSLKGNDQIRQQFLELKDMLDQYNNGIIGPGKCEESSAEFPYRIE